MTTATIDTCALAALMEYPWEKPAFADKALAARLKPLVRYVAKHPVEELQERFTRMFDLTPSTPPYLAYQIHGETYRRGDVMARLRALCRTHGVDEGGELPDHLGVVLKLIAAAPTDPDLLVLVRDELQPGLAKLIQVAEREEATNPYRAVLDAARAAMEDLVR